MYVCQLMFSSNIKTWKYQCRFQTLRKETAPVSTNALPLSLLKDYQATQQYCTLSNSVMDYLWTSAASFATAKRFLLGFCLQNMYELMEYRFYIVLGHWPEISSGNRSRFHRDVLCFTMETAYKMIMLFVH